MERNAGGATMNPRPSPTFSATERKAIREGKLTQARRVVMPKDMVRKGRNGVELWSGFLGWMTVENAMNPELTTNRRTLGPYGKSGDVWYLREPLICGDMGRTTKYQDDGDLVRDGCGLTWLWRWKPASLSSMFMPAWAARTFLRITGVRVERIQDISDADCKAHGTSDVEHGCLCPLDEYIDFVRYCGKCGNRLVNWQEDFRQDWDSKTSNRPGCSWKDNPFVWAYAFRPATPEEVKEARP